MEQERISNCYTFSGQKRGLYAARLGGWFCAIYSQIDLLHYSLKPKVSAWKMYKWKEQRLYI